MATKEFYKSLEKLESELKEELQAISILLRRSREANGSISSNASVTVHTAATGKYSKGDRSWVEYWKFLLKDKGGVWKTGELAKIAIEHNPEINKDIILRSCRGKLSQLASDNIINVIKNDNKKEGNKYSAK